MSILRILREIDDETARFQSQSGITCPPGCGACCENARVATTVAELVPLAEHLVATGAAESVLKRAGDGKGRTCVFYEQRSPGKGRCGVYAHRPSICRLFGFAGVRVKDHVELASCHHHRESQPAVVDAAEDAVAAGRMQLPVFSDVERRIRHADATLGREQMPINEALVQALRVVIPRR